MKPIEVTLRKSHIEKLIPTSFVYQGEVYQVESVGRRWQEEDGEHLLVMTLPDHRAYELVFQGETGTWGLVRGHDRPTVRMV